MNKVMNIALIMPESTFLIDPMVYPPLGLWYLASHLEAVGYEVDYFDLSKDKLPEDGDFDQLWVSATSAQMHSIRLHNRNLGVWSKTATVLGGPAVWSSPEKYTDLGFDLLVAGEADYTEGIEEIVYLANREKGKHRGKLISLGTRIGKLPTLPPIRRWSHRYNASLIDRHKVEHKTTTMFTSRGCPMACAFCESGRNGVIWDRVVRYEPLELVEQQLIEIIESDFTGIMFYDDILPLNKSRMTKLMKLLKEYGFVWRCFLRTDIIEKQGGFDYLREMADAGLVEVLAGIESADNRIKENIWKGTTIEQDTQALKWCKELGIKFKASFILGLPGEDRESMLKTKEWILENKPDRVDVNTLIPFPGTPITSEQAQFDLYWTDDVPEEFWYKGPREESQSLVGTSSLTPEEIQRFRDGLVGEIMAYIPY